ncbi:MAG: hypothetical protein Q8K60_03425 [Parachlamydiaceae bacterium]|nr:hypothetical protein [Parachlamydiaceae bacterium]
MSRIPTENKMKVCFFCSKPIIGKKTLEHIIPDSLLGKLGIKEKILHGQTKTQYSRIKVPAHGTCNSEFGSRYENEILALLESPDSLYESLIQDENAILLQYQPSSDNAALITTWLSKIYYGLFYNDYLKVDSSEWNEVCKEIIDNDNFRLIQQSYEKNHGFSLPSSLFVFKTNNEEFDLVTYALPQAILIKIKSLVFILCIADGYLTKAYLNGEKIKLLKDYLSNELKLNPKFPLHSFAFAEIVALRINIPKTPSFAYSNEFMLNMSTSTSVEDPQSFYKVDEKKIIEDKKDILRNMNIIET